MILRLTALPEFEASEVIIEGRRFLLIPFDALDGIYRREQAAPAAEKPIHQAKAEKPKPVKPASEKPADPPDSEVNAEILALLGKRPMTSGECIEALKNKRTPGAVYQALSVMRKAGLVESKDDDNGFRKNFRRAA